MGDGTCLSGGPTKLAHFLTRPVGRLGKFAIIQHLAKANKHTTIMRMFCQTTGLCPAIVLAFLAACSSRDVAPGLASCSASGCNPKTIVSGTGFGGAGNAIDSGTLGVTLNVSVVEFDHGVTGAKTWSTASVQELSGTFTVNLPSTLGTLLTETGGSPLTFDNVLVSGQSWVSAVPAANSGHSPGMRNIPADSAGSVSVPLLRTSDLEFVPTLLSTQPLTIDSSKAQVAIKVADANGAGVSGVRALDMGAAAMAYLSGNIWIDTSTNPATDVSGLIIAINLNALSQPGGLVTATLTGLTSQGLQLTVTGLIPVQAGFVSYGTVLFQ